MWICTRLGSILQGRLASAEVGDGGLPDVALAHAPTTATLLPSGRLVCAPLVSPPRPAPRRPNVATRPGDRSSTQRALAPAHAPQRRPAGQLSCVAVLFHAPGDVVKPLSSPPAAGLHACTCHDPTALGPGVERLREGLGASSAAAPSRPFTHLKMRDRALSAGICLRVADRPFLPLLHSLTGRSREPPRRALDGSSDCSRWQPRRAHPWLHLPSPLTRAGYRGSPASEISGSCRLV